MVQNKELEDLQREVGKHIVCIKKHESYISSITMAYVEKYREFEEGEEVLFNDTTAKVIGVADFEVESGRVYYTVAKAKKDGGFSAKHQRTYENDVLRKK